MWQQFLDNDKLRSSLMPLTHQPTAMKTISLSMVIKLRIKKKFSLALLYRKMCTRYTFEKWIVVSLSRSSNTIYLSMYGIHSFFTWNLYLGLIFQVSVRHVVSLIGWENCNRSRSTTLSWFSSPTSLRGLFVLEQEM